MKCDRVGKCSKCGRDAAWNTPHVDGENTLFCNRCAYDSRVFLIGVSQFKDEDGNYARDSLGHFTKNHCTLSGGSAYSNDGSKAFIMTSEEKELAKVDPESILDKIIAMREAKRYRCTNCGIEMDESEVGAYPLFAGVICKKCAVEYEKHVEHERKTGQVCRMCRQPYSLCCC